MPRTNAPRVVADIEREPPVDLSNVWPTPRLEGWVWLWGLVAVGTITLACLL